ncbi:hypothetical protein PhCBS80983_g01785 [Powellomyces hirtus]|uniref:Ser-Thr-rich glycosyl-phosphatidyl-inositol-anchored membrane family-domain-containing protein n=1 Tax=Powellomyces hirtus TaxID=109895 RepID=A0A507E9C7_9FUNG|nr:hypothetical protein PhCBS80983_g01785 [Powellomyces hirtus]
MRNFAIVATTLAFLLPLASTQTVGSSASIVFPTSPIGNTVWTTGTTAKITWTIVEKPNDAINRMTIELGVGENSTVEGTGIFPAPAPGIPYPNTLELDYAVPASLAPRKYCLIFRGRDDDGNTYGPSWATWFTIQSGTAAGASSAVVLPSSSSAITAASNAPATTAPVGAMTQPSAPSPSSAATATPTQKAEENSGATGISAAIYAVLAPVFLAFFQ